MDGRQNVFGKIALRDAAGRTHPYRMLAVVDSKKYFVGNKNDYHKYREGKIKSPREKDIELLCEEIVDIDINGNDGPRRSLSAS